MYYLFFFTLLFSIYLCGASIDLTITTQAAKYLSNSNGLATVPYALMGLGTMLSARYGIYAFIHYSVRRVFIFSSVIAVISGLLSYTAIITQQFFLLCAAIFLIGIYCGFSNYYRILIVHYVPEYIRDKATAICMSGGVIAACVGPILAVSLSKGGATYQYAYAAVIFLGLGALCCVPALPDKVYNPDKAAVQRQVSPGHGKNTTKSELTAASIIAFVPYIVMTLVMTSGPLQALYIKADNLLFAASVQIHMIAMYLPMLAVAYLIKKLGANTIIQTGLLFGAVTLSTVIIFPPAALLFSAMLCAGLFWALVYSAGSTLMALNSYGQAHAAARGKSELLPPIGMMIGSLLSGAVFNSVGFRYLVLYCALILFITFLLNYLFRQQQKSHA